MSTGSAPNFVRTTKEGEPHSALAEAMPLNTTFRCATAPLNQDRLAAPVPAPTESLSFPQLRASAEKSHLVRHIDSCEREVASLQATAVAAGRAQDIEIDGIKPLEYVQMLRDVAVTYLAYVSHFDSYGLDGEAQKYLSAASKACVSSKFLTSQLKTFCEEELQVLDGVTGTGKAFRSGSKTANDTTTPRGVSWLHDSTPFWAGVRSLISLAWASALVGDRALTADVIGFLEKVYNDPTKVVRCEIGDDAHVQGNIRHINRHFDEGYVSFQLEENREWLRRIASTISVTQKNLSSAVDSGLVKKLGFLQEGCSFEARLSAARRLWSEMSSEWQQALPPDLIAKNMEFLGVYEDMFLVLGHRGPILDPSTRTACNGFATSLQRPIGVVMVNLEAPDLRAVIDHEISHLILGHFEWRGVRPDIEGQMINELCARLQEHGTHFSESSGTSSIREIQATLEQNYLPMFIVEELVNSRFRHQSFKIGCSPDTAPHPTKSPGSGGMAAADIREQKLHKFLHELDWCHGSPAWSKFGEAMAVLEGLIETVGPEGHLLARRILIVERSLDSFMDQARGIIDRQKAGQSSSSRASASISESSCRVALD